MRRAAKIDDNQVEIANALRWAGCNVLSLAAVGKGCPDLLVERADTLYLIEVKDGAKSPSRRRLTAEQERFHRIWSTPKVVATVDEALEAVGLKQ